MTVRISEPIQERLLTGVDHAHCTRFILGSDTRCQRQGARVRTHLGVDVPAALSESPLQDRTTLEPTRVLIITHDPTLKNVLKAICMTRGIQMVPAALTSEDEEPRPDVDLTAFGLVVVDIAAFGGSEWRQKRLSCRLLRNWTETYPTQSFLFIGTVSQKRAILAIRADTVRFLTRPTTWHELVRAVEAIDRAKAHRPRPLPLVADTAKQEPMETVTNGS